MHSGRTDGRGTTCRVLASLWMAAAVTSSSVTFAIGRSVSAPHTLFGPHQVLPQLKSHQWCHVISKGT